jgi:subtilisin family serine protease
MRGAGVEVAVIDDGVDPGNPDLSGSGKVVDGGDCSGDSCLASGGTTPSGFHGTAVAALIAASEDGQGIVGGAPDATIVALARSGKLVVSASGSRYGGFVGDCS